MPKGLFMMTLYNEIDTQKKINPRDPKSSITWNQGVDYMQYAVRLSKNCKAYRKKNLFLTFQHMKAAANIKYTACSKEPNG